MNINDYKSGDRIFVLKKVKGTNLSEGDRGIIEYTNKRNIIYCKWDNGSRYGLYIQKDNFYIMDYVDEYEIVYKRLSLLKDKSVLQLKKYDEVLEYIYLKKHGFISINQLKVSKSIKYISMQDLINFIISNKYMIFETNKYLKDTFVPSLEIISGNVIYNDSMIEVK